jgi:hypothetical protein
MPQFHFHLHDSRSDPDGEGCELADLSTACIAAVQLAGSILKEEAEHFLRAPAWRLDVTDAAGRKLFSVDVAARRH